MKSEKTIQLLGKWPRLAALPVLRRWQAATNTRAALWPLLSVLALAAAINASLFLRNPNVGGDGLEYLSVVFNWFGGHGYTNYQAVPWLVEPGYGLAAYAIYRLGFSPEIAAMLVSSLAYLTLVASVYLQVRALAGAAAAFAASSLTALTPYVLNYSYTNLTDAMFAALVWAAFVLFLGLVRRGFSTGRALALGLVCGITALTRVEGYIVALLCMGGLLALAILERRFSSGVQSMWPLRTGLAAAALVLAGTLALAVPFITAMHSLSGSWVLTPKDIVLPLEDRPQPVRKSGQIISASPPAQASSDAGFYNHIYFDRVGKNLPVLLANLFSINFHTLAAFGAALALALLLGGGATIWNELRLAWPRAWPGWFGFGVFFAPSLAYLVWAPHLRYLMPFSVYAIVGLSILAVQALAIAFRRRQWPYHRTLASVLVVAFGLAALTPYPVTAARMVLPDVYPRTLAVTLSAHHDWLGVRAAGIWLSQNTTVSPDIYIATDKRCIVALYYALDQRFPIGGQCWTRPNRMENWNDVQKFFQDGGDYLVFSEIGAPQSEAFASVWQQPTQAGQYGLQLLHRDPLGQFQIYTRKVK